VGSVEIEWQPGSPLQAGGPPHKGLESPVVATQAADGSAIATGLPPEAIFLTRAYAVAAIPIGPALEPALAASQTGSLTAGQRSVADTLTDARALIFDHGWGRLGARNGGEPSDSQAGDCELSQKAFHRVFLCNYKPHTGRKVVAAAAEIFHLSGAMLS